MIIQVLSSSNKLYFYWDITKKKGHMWEKQERQRQASQCEVRDGNKAGERGRGDLWTLWFMKTADMSAVTRDHEHFLESMFSSPLPLLSHCLSPTTPSWLLSCRSPTVRAPTPSLSHVWKQPEQSRAERLTVCSWITALLRSSSLVPTFKCASSSGKEIKVMLQELLEASQA